MIADELKRRGLRRGRRPPGATAGRRHRASHGAAPRSARTALARGPDPGPPLRCTHASPGAGLHRGDDRHAHAGHWRQHRRLQPRRSAAVSRSAGSGSRQSRAVHVAVPRRSAAEPVQSGELRAVSRPQHRVLGHGRPRATEDGVVRRQRADRRLGGHGELLPCARREARAGARAGCLRRRAGRSPSRRCELAVLAGALQRRGASPRRHHRHQRPSPARPRARDRRRRRRARFFWRDRQHAVGRLGVSWRDSHGDAIAGGVWR